MAGKIKGITVEIGGNTTGLAKALEGVNKQSGSLQKELKSVNNLLKLDPNNVVLVKQKQDLLKESIAATKQKLDTLKEAQSQVTEQFKSGKIGAEAYRDFQRELEGTKQSLSKLKDEKSSINVVSTAFHQAKDKVSEFHSKLEPVENTLKKVGSAAVKVSAEVGKITLKGVEAAAKGLVAYGTAALSSATAIGTWAVTTGAAFDEQMSKVEAISGATASEMNRLTQKAKEMGESTKFSAAESAQAFEYMAMAGWKTSDMVNGISGIMDLAAASGEDLANVSDIVTDALTAFGLQASDSGHFADVLAAASSNANTNVSMMGATFQYAAPVAGALGYSIEDVALATGLMANAGIKGEKAGTALRGMLTNLAKPTEQSANYMALLGISMTDAAGEVIPLNDLLLEMREKFAGLSEAQQAEYAAGIAGKEAMSGLLAIVNAAPADFEKLSGAISTCDGKSKEMSDTMQDNLKGDITLLKSNVEGVALSLNEKLSPSLRTGVQSINGIVTAFKSGGLEGALKSVSELIPKLAQTISEKAPELISSFLSGFNSVIVSFVQAVSTTLPSLIGGVLPALLEGFTSLVVALVEMLPTLLPQLVEGALALFLGLIDGLNEVVPKLMEQLPEIIEKICDTLIENLPSIIEGGFQLVIGLITGIANAAPTLIQKVVEMIPVIVKALMDNLPALVEAGLQLIVALAGGLIKAIPELLKSLPQIISSIVSGLLQSIGKIGEVGKDMIRGLWEGITSMGTWLWDQISGFFGGIVDGVKNFFGIHSPSTLFRDEIGRYMAEGIGIGFSDEMKNVSREMTRAIPTSLNGPSLHFGAVNGGAGGKAAPGMVHITLQFNERAFAEIVAPLVSQKISADTSRALRGRGLATI